jgi:hypothetical protein
MLPGCYITGVSFSGLPRPKRVAGATDFPTITIDHQLAPPRRDRSLLNEYDIASGMLSNVYKVTATKRPRHISPPEGVSADVVRDISCPASQDSPLSEQQRSIIKTTSDCLLDMVLSDTGPLSLRVDDTKSLAERITRMYTLMTMARAVNTRKQDTGSNWKYWLTWCGMHNTPPVRPYMDKRATVQEAATECYLWTAALPWIYKRMQPGAGRSVPKPTSALNVLRGVRRVQISLGYDPPALASLNLSLKGLMHEVIAVHGPEVLEIKRTLPIPFPAQCDLLRVMRSTGLRLGSRVTNGASCLFWCSLVALATTLASCGMRKAEVTSTTKKLSRTDLLRSNLTWIINHKIESDPTDAQLRSMTPGSSWAVIKPCPSKADPFGMVWGTKPIYLSYCPSKEINAATSLMELELMFPLHNDERHNRALFCDNDKMPLTGHALDRLLQCMLTAAGHTTLYSWHSFRAALACQLLEAGASTADIMALCRWQSEESLAGYAQHSAQAYTRLLNNAYARDFTQVRYSQTPVSQEYEMIRNMSGLHISA